MIRRSGVRFQGPSGRRCGPVSARRHRRPSVAAVPPVADSRPARLGRLLVVAAASVLVAGCRVGVSVELEAGMDGGGEVRATVTLDEEAAAQVPDLAEQLRVDDLRRAGWQVEGPSPTPGGGASLRAAKRFGSPEGADRAVEELSGPGGPFRSLRLTHERSFWKTRSALTGSLDLSAGLDVFGDAALTELLGGPSFGMDPAEVERELGRPLAEVFALEVVGRLPGRVESNAPLVRDGARVWPAGLGETVAVRASAEAWNVPNLALAAVALVSGAALLVVLVSRSRRVSWG